MRAIPRMLATILTLAWVPVAQGQGAVPAGGEFQVNSHTTGNQWQPEISPLAGGDFVVVWTAQESSGSDTSGVSVQGRLYDAGGTAMGEQFQVNSYTTGHQLGASLAPLIDGGFVVAWDVTDSIRARRFAGDGTPLAGDFQVESLAAGFSVNPSVAALASGGFIVAWRTDTSAGSDTSITSIQGRIFAAGGQPSGEQFQVNSLTPGSQVEPHAAGLADGGFVVVWKDFGLTAAPSNIRGRVFDAGGGMLGQELLVNTHATGDQESALVAALADGGFLAVWSSLGSSGSDTSGHSVQGRRYAAGGSPFGPPFQVNAYTRGRQTPRSIAAAADGGFVVAWTSDGSSGSDVSYTSVQTRRYAAGGEALGGDFQVNTTTAYLQHTPAVAAGTDGGFMVVWRNALGSNSADVRGRLYADPRFALAGLGGKCLEVEGGDPSDGTPVNLGDCTGGENQTWRLDLTSWSQQVVAAGDKCLLPGPVDDAGDVRAVIGECGVAGDLWRLETPAHAESSLLIHDDTGLCLDVQGSVSEDGRPVILFGCHGGANQLWRPAAEICTRDTLGTCLSDERFRIDLAWRSFDGTTGSGNVVPVGSDDSGLLWFFEDDNWEMLIKVLDGCAINDRFWVFAATTTTVEYTLTVTDTATGEIRDYFNLLGTAAPAITDTDAFATCAAARPARRQPRGPATGAKRGQEKLDATLRTRTSGATCIPSETRMCLAGGRFSVDVAWRDYAGDVGPGRVIDTGLPPLGADDTSGLLWFFDDANWEMLVKVLDACDVNGLFLFLGAATPDVEYTLTVTDTETDVSWQHTNPLGQASEALVHWFDTCP